MRAQILDVWSLVVRFVMRLARPVFVKHEFRRVVRRDVQVVIDAAGLLARRREHRGQRPAQPGLFPGRA